jgi:thiamine transporter
MLAEGKTMSKNKTRFSTKIIAEVVAFVAMSTALSYIKVFSLPQGGSITAGSMVPVLWLSLRRGLKIGLFACIVYGFVQLAVEPFIFYPAQVLLDYPVAFGALGLAGLFKNRPKMTWRTPIGFDAFFALVFSGISFTLFCYELTLFALGETLFFAWIFVFSFLLLVRLYTKERKPEEREAAVLPALFGATVGITGRFIAHFVSGVVFFPQYAPEGMNPIVYSALYNGAYIVPELLVSAYLLYLIAKRGLLRIYE